VNTAPAWSDAPARPRRRTGISQLLRLLAVPAALLVLVPAAPVPAHAEPGLTEVERQLSAVGEKMERATEQYNDAREDLKASRAREAALKVQAGLVRKKLTGYRAQVEAYAALTYRSGTSPFLSVLENGSTQRAMDQMTFLTYLSEQHRAELNALLDAKAELVAAQSRIEREVAAQVKHENTLRSRRAAILADVSRWEKLRKKLAPAGSTGGPPPVYTGAAVGRARLALKFAYAQIGKPYVWGAAGPGSFDCSGLTLRAWERAGVYMPHSASKQYARFPKVSRSKLKPGDLVFFYRDLHHVGIYIGGGKMIHAPTTGRNVEIAGIDSAYRQYMGAVRPF
jgi:cell wall-associated NlpC family hydrolase